MQYPPQERYQQLKDEYFSSDESGCTDISFNSSFDSETAMDEEEDYSDKVKQLKEQINQLFLKNPSLKDNIDFNKKEIFDSDGELIPEEDEF